MIAIFGLKQAFWWARLYGFANSIESMVYACPGRLRPTGNQTQTSSSLRHWHGRVRQALRTHHRPDNETRALRLSRLVTLLVHLQVYADRYLELLDSPPELSAPEDNTSSFHISVRMSSPDFGPYACLVFHDPVGTPLTIGELQQQFSGPYSDFTTSQVINNPNISRAVQAGVQILHASSCSDTRVLLARWYNGVRQGSVQF